MAKDLTSDDRTDPRALSALTPFGMQQRALPPPVTTASPIEDKLDFVQEAEAGFEAVFDGLFSNVAPLSEVDRELREIVVRGHSIALHIHRPANAASSMPCVIHFHGGGMTMLRAESTPYKHWRDSLAAEGLLVIGVEFRNAGGVLGPHPFPAGLDDCADAVLWVKEHQDEFNVSSIVVSGDSGGGNLALSCALRAKQEGWDKVISGVYAQCPYISGAYANPPPTLPSMQEFNGYFINTEMMGVLASVYDPSQEHVEDPLAWPLLASQDLLTGLPPHIISVNELDPLRDEGLVYHRKLVQAGVAASSRIVPGTFHFADCILFEAMPDVCQHTIRDIASFAYSL